ncbi:hypothetical protein [Flavobacterium sp. NKUCC04_CG]|uniref:hypothetical protein n=1 Tax=Flavobacterium sp. NKUCC04_CG TaxID=2842121 RepID=UPI001C5BA704|nr:hypothetical protein [Flavobacterium sp. NKUCC04_CG]MBW3518753.1 hypothetical protein [Flavobacterium sp. NKUCC04_CG]
MSFKIQILVYSICHTKGLTPSNLRFRAAAGGVENDCDSCKTKADWQAYYQQAENTASMIGEDAWEGLNNKRMSRAIDDNGNSIFYLDGKKMDLRTYENKTHAIGSLLGDAALIEGGARLFKYFSNAFSKSKDAAKGVTRSLDDLSSLRGATWKEAESMIPKDWIKGAMKKGEGIKFVNPAKKGEQILLEKGWQGAKDPLHAGPYMKVSRNGQVTRIPLSGNPTLK